MMQERHLRWTLYLSSDTLQHLSNGIVSVCSTYVRVSKKTTHCLDVTLTNFPAFMADSGAVDVGLSDFA